VPHQEALAWAKGNGTWRRLRSVVALGVALGAASARAQAQAQTQAAEDEPKTASLAFHAFVSQGALKSTNNNYLVPKSNRGSADFTEVGANFTADLTDKLRVGAQVFAHDLGQLGNYTPTFDWYYLDYHFHDWLGLRAGRTKIPFGLYNDSADIDAARVSVLLPKAVYPIDHREYLLAQTGAELYGNRRLGPVGELEYRAYGGTLDLAPPAPPAAGITIHNLDVPYVYGGRLLWLTPLEGLTAAGSYQALRFDWDYQIAPEVAVPLQSVGLLPAGFGGTLPIQFRVKLWVASLEYQVGNLALTTEYSRWIGRFHSDAPQLLPPHVVNERYYGMLSYHVTPWFTPGAYYSVYFPNVEQRASRQNYQRDLAVSWRFDVSENWLFKLEGHWMNGTAALDSSLNDGKQLKDLDKNWALFLLKTTAYF
jgi:hypothetical protein